MAISVKKIILEKAGEVSLVKNNVIVAVCAILIAANVAAFIFFPKLLAPVAIVVSNAVTVILMLFAFLPMRHIMDNVLKKEFHEIEAKERENEDLREKNTELENKYREAVSKLDTWGQMSSLPTNLNFSAKLETMVYEKKGYLVKEESVEMLVKDPSFKPADPQTIMEKYRVWKDKLSHSGEKTVLYIGKQYVSRTLGIDFSKVKYAFENGRVALYGASITKIHNIEPDKDKGDISYCWVLDHDKNHKDKISISTAEHFQEIPGLYAKECERQAREEADTEVQQLCEHYTTLFRRCLSGNFPGVVFCDSIDDSSSTWYALNQNSNDPRVAPIASGMFLVANVLNSFNIDPAKQIEG